MATKHKFVYFFGGGKAEGRAKMKELLGGKGANLAEMSALCLQGLGRLRCYTPCVVCYGVGLSLRP